MVNRYEKYVNQATARIMKNAYDLLPDRCTIQSIKDLPTISETGIQERTIYFRLFNGDILIPCRLDASRAFRPERFPNQEVNANEYIFHFPKTVTVLPNDKILVLGRLFEVRKLNDLPTYRATNEALIVELQGQY